MVLKIIKGFLYFAFVPGMTRDTSGQFDAVESAKVHKALIPDKIIPARIVYEYFGIIYLYLFADPAKQRKALFECIKDITLGDTPSLGFFALIFLILTQYSIFNTPLSFNPLKIGSSSRINENHSDHGYRTVSIPLKSGQVVKSTKPLYVQSGVTSFQSP